VEIIIGGAKKYRDEQRAKSDFPKYVKHAQGWINGERWLDEGGVREITKADRIRQALI